MSTLRDALVAALREAGIDHDYKKAVFVHPYSGHDALVNFHEARGYRNGIARAIEIFDAYDEDAPAVRQILWDDPAMDVVPSYDGGRSDG
jgi:hypothetical protein